MVLPESKLEIIRRAGLRSSAIRPESDLIALILGKGSFGLTQLGQLYQKAVFTYQQSDKVGEIDCRIV
jgi:hypothetical protein